MNTGVDRQDIDRLHCGNTLRSRESRKRFHDERRKGKKHAGDQPAAQGGAKRQDGQRCAIHAELLQARRGGPSDGQFAACVSTRCRYLTGAPIHWSA
jgi:hypothetical protein